MNGGGQVTEENGRDRYVLGTLGGCNEGHVLMMKLGRRGLPGIGIRTMTVTTCPSAPWDFTCFIAWFS